MSRIIHTRMVGLLLLAFLVGPAAAFAGENWLQFKYDCRHSGNVADRNVAAPLGLIGTVPLTDAVFTAPVVADGRVYVVDGAGVAFCLDAATLRVVWKVETRGGNANCNNVSSPAIAGRYLHFGTMAGSYYVLERESGKVVTDIRCGGPIFSTPVVREDRVYFATLGSRIYALKPDGTVCWTWDFVKEQLGFTGDRWSGKDWYEHKGDRVTWDEQFCCSRDLALYGKTLLVPAGPSLVWLEDVGNSPQLRAMYRYRKSESFRVTTLGLSIGESGAVYRQMNWPDNTGEVEIIRHRDGEVEVDSVPGTQTAARLPGLLSFSSVSLRGTDVYRCRPEEGFGLCRHVCSDRIDAVPSSKKPDESGHYEQLGGYPSIAPPILLHDTAVYGGLDGSLHVVPLRGDGNVWSFETAFGKAITAPVAVCDGRVYFGCEDGYLYVLGPGGKAPLPTSDLELWKIRSPLVSEFAEPKYDWFTNYGNCANTDATDQALAPPFRIKWIRRYQGTVNHFSTCGGGRMYTHTAEGQIFAVEQDTGRLLWRQYFPGVYISYTAAVYHDGRLLVPQAGLQKCRLRCLDAATGKLLWEAPFSGSPGFNRNMSPVIYKNLAIYMFGTGKYTPGGTPQTIGWLHSGGVYSRPGLLKDHKPLVRAWDVETGKEVWTRDFSEFGSGGDDSGLCLMDGVLYYSCFFGPSAKTRRGLPGPTGVTAAIDPPTGRLLWSTTKHSVHSACTISADGGRLYLGGYVPAGKCHVWCLDARDGSLIWESEPLLQARNVVAVGRNFLATATQSKAAVYLIDKDTGKILTELDKPYMCTRYSLSEPYLLGPNMDILDTSTGKFVSSGPAVDPNGCVSAIVSNGRIFFTSQSGGLQVSQVYGSEAASFAAPWQTPAGP